MSSRTHGIAPRAPWLSTAVRAVVVNGVVGASVIVGALVGCGDDGVRAPVTIVVDTDGARVREDVDRLREAQRGVQDDRAQLERARLDLDAARKSLATAASPEQKQSLQRQVRDLEARLTSGAIASADVVTRAELDAQLRAQEERLKTFISTELQGRPATSLAAPATTATTATATTATTAMTAPSSTTKASAARAHLIDGRKRLQQLAVDAADINAVALVDQAEATLARGDDAAALAPAAAFAERAAAAVVNAALVRRKFDRVSAVLTNRALVGEPRARADSLLQDAATRLSAGDAVGANAALNSLLVIAR